MGCGFFGNYKGKYLGSGSDGWKYWDELRAGNITENDWAEVESVLLDLMVIV